MLSESGARKSYWNEVMQPSLSVASGLYGDPKIVAQDGVVS